MRQLIFKHLIRICLLLLLNSPCIGQENLQIKPSRIVFAPSDTSLWNEWKNILKMTRENEKKRIHYSDILYTDKNFKWASHCYNVCMLMLFDKRFYNAKSRKYDVPRFVNDGIKLFGGYDGVVLWHAYPRIGFDERNQYDFYREFPGGLNSLKSVVKQFHQKGIRVFIDYNPWDKGTKREKKPDMDMLADIIKVIDADGIFLDTMDGSVEEFSRKLNEVRKGIILESELELPVERIHNHHMSWAQYYEDSYVPGIPWTKWFERRHLLHMTKRWETDHSSELQMAFMNGCGMITWENIFGIPNLYNNRDKSIFRSMVPIQRRYHDIFSGEGWEPLFKVNLPDVFANKWNNEKYQLWTIVNRSYYDKNGLLFSIKHVPGIKYFNLITGKETGIILKDSLFIYETIRSRSISAIISVNAEDINPDFISFLHKQAVTYSTYNSDTSRIYSDETLLAAPSAKYGKANIPPNMIYIKDTVYRTTTRYTQRECGFYNLTGRFVNDLANQKWFAEIIQDVNVSLKSYAIDETPVTNQQYYDFIQATKYHPGNQDHFLNHWINGHPPKGKWDHPVVNVNIDDARAFAKWTGKRLPTEAEWQYAAEGPLHNAYPWGNIFNEAYCNNGRFNGTTPVRKFEKGRSFFGCYDMCGNTWEWTESEREDQLTRFCIIKGGSFYKAEGSEWYTDGRAQRTDFSSKFILINPGLDRCATIGFRCAVDIAQ